MTQTSTRPVTLHTYLGYRDAPAALDWLARAFGFTATMQFPDERGGLAHAELRLGDAAIIIFSDHEGYDRLAPKGDTVGNGIYLSVADEPAVDTVYATAVAAGACGVWEPARSEWNYRCRVRDLEGREWTFGTHRPCAPVAPADWSE